MNNTSSDGFRNRLEVYSTIILAIATLFVAWCSYQSALWSGIQTFRLAESNKYGRLAQQKLIQSGQSKAMEEVVFIEFINAAYAGDKEKMDFIIKAVRPELAQILTNWIQSHPFDNNTVLKNPVVIPEFEKIMQKRIEESAKMSSTGEEKFKAAEKANTISDKYSLVGVMLSMVMFLGAIITKLVRTLPRLILASLSALILLGVMVLVFFYLPVAHKG